MKQLIIAEKPSVAKDLAKVLGANQVSKTHIEGSNVIVTWAYGHLLGLKMPEDYNKEWASWQMETLPMIPKKFGIKPLPKTGGQLKAISQLSKRKDVGEAVIATDAGREGELVARWILEYIRFNKPVKRLWISSQTTKAIKEGFQHLKPGKAYDNLYSSAIARSEADWLVGLNVTRALTVKYNDSLSAGRVQTPTLAMIKKQEEKIEQFVPQTYFSVDLVFQEKKGRLQLKNPQQFKERDKVETFVKELEKATPRITSIQRKKKSIPAPLPYDLTELQRDANQRYQFSAKKTLGIVQSLYEVHKVSTYPRTDSKYLTTDMEGTMKERLQALASEFDEAKAILKKGAKVQQRSVFQNAKVTDHHALIPTEQRPRFEKMDQDEIRIYQMIVSRFFGLFSGPYVTEIETVTVSINNETCLFKEEKVIEEGWKKDVSNSLSNISWKEGMTLPSNYSINKEVTSPPSLLSEGTLLAQMEKYSLGTPATRAEIIEKLIKSELMARQNGKLSTTPKGKQLLQLVNPSLVSPDLTSKWEHSLEEIAEGKLNKDKFIDSIIVDTKTLVREIKNSEQIYQDFSLTQKKCPECGSLLKEKSTKNGIIYVCTGENCNYSRRKDPVVSNHRCPQCHKKMEIIDGKNGRYFKCKFCGISEKMQDNKGGNRKLSKHEERKLLKKYSQKSQANDTEEESPLAQALRAAMEKNNK